MAFKAAMILGNLIGLTIINTLFQAPALWYAGEKVLHIETVNFNKAAIITAVYTVINTILIGLMTFEEAGFFQILTYLYVVKRYFQTTWKQAVLVTLVMVSINIIIALLLAGPGLLIYHR